VERSSTAFIAKVADVGILYICC